MLTTEIINFNKEDLEADIKISDGDYSLKCYMYPAKIPVFKEKKSIIDALYCENIVKSNRKIYEVKKLSQYYAYYLTAQVLDREKRMVGIGALIIHLDTDIPEDIINGDYINFSVTRLDWN